MEKNKKESILCPQCRKLISKSEYMCPYCGTIKPGTWWKNNILTQKLSHTESIIKMLIYINVGMFLFSILLNPKTIGFSVNPLTFLSPDGKSLLLLGASGAYPINQMHRWWTLVSANYLHGGVLHIFFNMLALRQLALLIFREYGNYRGIIIYSISGVSGFFISYLANVPFTIGASASVCGLIGASLYYGKNRGGRYGQAIFRQIGGWTLGIFVFGLMVPGIDNWAHGGGIIAGALLGFLLGYQEKKRETFMHRSIAGICIICTLAVLIWSIVSACLYRFFT